MILYRIQCTNLVSKPNRCLGDKAVHRRQADSAAVHRLIYQLDPLLHAIVISIQKRNLSEDKNIFPRRESNPGLRSHFLKIRYVNHYTTWDGISKRWTERHDEHGLKKPNEEQ